MPSLLIKAFAAGILAAASLAAGAQTLLTQIPLGSFTGDLANIDVAVNSATNRIYVPIEFDDGSQEGKNAYHYFRVLVINGATNQVVHNLDDFPSGSFYNTIAVDPVRNFTYVQMTNDSQTTVSVIDGRTEETVKTISLPADDYGSMVVDPVTGKVYIRSLGELVVIESEATGSIETFSVPALRGPGGRGGLAVSPYVHRLYVTYDEGGANTEYLGFFDTLDDQISQQLYITGEIDYGFNPMVNPATGHIFGKGQDGAVTVYDSGGILLANIKQSANILSVDVDAKTNLVFAFAHTSTGENLEVIDGTSNTIRSSALVSPPPSSNYFGGSVAVNPDTSRVYVPCNESARQTSNVSGNFYLNVYSE